MIPAPEDVTTQAPPGRTPRLGLLRAEKRTAQVDGNHPIEGFDRQPVERDIGLENAGVQEGGIHTAECLFGGVEHRLVIRLARDVGGDGDRRSAGGGDQFDRAPGSGFITVDHHDAGAFESQALAGRAADAGNRHP